MSFRLCDGWWVGGFRLIVMDGRYSFDRVFLGYTVVGGCDL